jgi:hypothetical protein
MVQTSAADILVEVVMILRVVLCLEWIREMMRNRNECVVALHEGREREQ